MANGIKMSFVTCDMLKNIKSEFCLSLWLQFSEKTSLPLPRRASFL